MYNSFSMRRTRDGKVLLYWGAQINAPVLKDEHLLRNKYIGRLPTESRVSSGFSRIIESFEDRIMSISKK